MSKRLNQINELIKQEVSKIIEKEIGSEIGFLTVTSVSTTSDLRLADVWVSVYRPKIKDVESYLQEFTPVVQKILNKRLKMKYVPRINFKIDKSISHAFEIDEILQKIKK